MNPAFKVEHGVPIPPPKCRGSKWPLREMGVGDSFFVPTAMAKNLANRVRSKADYLRQKITVRQVDGGFRIWRTK